jgi:hypothetical protein
MKAYVDLLSTIITIWIWRLCFITNNEDLIVPFAGK